MPSVFVLTNGDEIRGKACGFAQIEDGPVGVLADTQDAPWSKTIVLDEIAGIHPDPMVKRDEHNLTKSM